MSILIDEHTRVLIQGITGHEGSRACREMLLYGTKVLAGVTPGKGGLVLRSLGEGGQNVPVYDTIKEALKKHPEINASLIAVPAPFVKDSAMEAICAGISLIDILTEHVPTQDSAYIVAWARQKGIRVVGPASVGIISPGKAKLGSIGSSEISQVFKQGEVGVISKSGGMTAEIASILTKAGLGQSTVLGIGGDQIVGSDFVDIMLLFENDLQTKAIVLFGEIGGTYEEKVAEYISQEKCTKPVIAIIAGKFSKKLPHETVLGHAGAIVAKGRGSYESKVKALKNAGVLLADTLEEIPILVKKALYESTNDLRPTTNDEDE
ncbi:MAG: succinate--CoA ligase subunit alpha [Candidatus Portnoybacteria bacterium]|nr:succinate--CoA ligase subunit alpha [Candidatus Portnoybacteria bacterium]